MIRVVIVDDSPVVLELLRFVLDDDPNLQIIGTAQDGEEAIRIVAEKKPDIVLMDINMPKMNGFEATRKIMETTPVPIIIITSARDPKEVAVSFEAMQVGALACLQKPLGIDHKDYEQTARELKKTVRLMAGIPVIRRWNSVVRPSAVPERVSSRQPSHEFGVVAIGASTGGPAAIETILSLIPHNLPVPILIVQHMSEGFTGGFVDWLIQSSEFPVIIPSNSEVLKPGYAYVAPEGLHMGMDNNRTIRLSPAPPENGLRPSVSYLFRSVHSVYGNQVIAVLLTGMGDDGADELLQLKNAGAVTFAQDEGSSVIFGMPGVAIKRGAALYVMPPTKIAVMITDLVFPNGNLMKNSTRTGSGQEI
ncbi:MAG: chemotaxis-specific protein-glutamate methyltransferase CheB [Methanobacteriota archaeon]